MNCILVCAALVGLGGFAALALARYARIADALFGGLVVAGCLCGAVAALRPLSGATITPVLLTSTLPGGPWSFGLDGLSAWFVLILCVAGGISTLFGVSYMQIERAHRSVAVTHALWAVLLVAMLGVLVAQSAVFFLLAWEVMAVSAYFLMMFDHERAEVRRSGLVYLVLTHLGTLGLLFMFLLRGTGAADLSFASLAAAGGGPPWAGTVILLLALFGFGIKAGIVPLHFWLPGAHAAAPSHISSVLSGVMLKIGIYGLLRMLVLLGPAPAWWGWVVLVLGAVSAVLGVLWALAQHDLKRALAYSSVENIGIILLGLGLGVLGTAYHRPLVAVLGYTAALLHSLNHGLFKSLLFLGAGAVVQATGVRDIDRLGGLARRMPGTATAFLVGSIAIVGLPPLNGFVSEWTLIQGFLVSGHEPGPLRFAVVGAACIGVVSALALACFVRLGGTVFLGEPRDGSIREARDAGAGMVLPMALLGLLCVAVGSAPAAVLGSAVNVASGLALGQEWGHAGAPLAGGYARGLRVLGPLLVAAGSVLWFLRSMAGRSAGRRTSATWGCAFPQPTPRMQYTGSSFALPILRAFAIPAGPASGAATAQARRFHDLARPIWSRIEELSQTLRPLQQGRITAYLQYMIWTVLLLLGFLWFTSRGPGQ